MNSERTDRLAETLDPAAVARLRAAAGRLMAGERAGHTLTPTELVNEAVRRLLESPAGAGADVLPAVAAVVMRRVLIDHARGRRARPDRARRADVDAEALADDLGPGDEAEAREVAQVVAAMAAVNPRAAQVLRLRFWDGLGVRETAERLDVSPTLVKLDTAWAKAYLRDRLGPG